MSLQISSDDRPFHGGIPFVGFGRNNFGSSYTWRLELTAWMGLTGQRVYPCLLMVNLFMRPVEMTMQFHGLNGIDNGLSYAGSLLGVLEEAMRVIVSSDGKNAYAVSPLLEELFLKKFQYR